jgi:hypothetical protein
LAVKEAEASAVLKPDPLKAVLAVPQVTPDPLDQLENVTPVGGVVQVAVGVAGHVTVAPPPTVTTVCAILFPEISKNKKAKLHNASEPAFLDSKKFFINYYLIEEQKYT